MEQTKTPREPPAMSRGTGIAYAIGLPAGLLGLIFVPTGTIAWWPGWVFLAVLISAFGVSALVIARINPIIYRARSRFQQGTKGWDKALLAVILPAMVAILPVAALDAGRFHWSAVPFWALLSGYIAVLAGVAVTGWAQVVNPYFEPGVRIQSASARDRRRPIPCRAPPRLYRRTGSVLRHGACAGFVLGPGARGAGVVGARPAHRMGRPAVAGRTSRI